MQLSDEELWRLYQEQGENATAVADNLGMAGSHIRARIRRIKKNLAIVAPESVADHLSDLLEKSATPSKLIENAHLKKLVVGSFPFSYKNDDGEGVTEGLFTKRATFEFNQPKSKIEWPPIVPQHMVEVKTYTPLPPSEAEFERVYIFGDVQIGFWRDNGSLTPFHDEAAIDASLQMLARYRPHRVVIIGDFLDFPELGKYRKEPAFAFTLNPAIAYATELLAKIRAIVGPDCIIDFVPGNHEARLTSAIVDNLAALYGIRRPGDQFSLLSIPYLLQFEKLNIRCAEQYPSGQVWLTDDIVCTHAPDKRLRATQICGHLVRATVDSETFHYREGPKNYKTFIVPGLGNYGGKPADKHRLNRTNIPSNVARSNAEQACATVEITRDKKHHKVTVWEINDGFCFFKDGAIQGVAQPWFYTEAA